MSNLKIFINKNRKHILSTGTISLLISLLGAFFAFNANQIANRTYYTTIRPIVTLDRVDFRNRSFLLKNVTQGTALHIGGFIDILKDDNTWVRFRKNSDQIFSANTSYELSTSELFGVTPNASFSGISIPFSGGFCFDYESMDGTKYFTAGYFSSFGVGKVKYQEGVCNSEGDTYLHKPTTRIEQ